MMLTLIINLKGSRIPWEVRGIQLTRLTEVG